MKLSDFSIGLEFDLDASRWRVTDVGTRTVVAIRVDRTVEVRARLIDDEVLPVGGTVLSGAESEAHGNFRGPPYGVVEKVFDEHDQPRCVPA